MMKRIIAAILCLSMVLSIPAYAAETEPVMEEKVMEMETAEEPAPEPENVEEPEAVEEPEPAEEPAPEMQEEPIPETTAAEETVPETTAAEETVPETTVAEETVPETTAAEETVPETTVAEETIPEETTYEIPLDEEPQMYDTAGLYEAMFRETSLRGLFELVNANTDALVGFNSDQVYDFENLISSLEKKNSPLNQDETEALEQLLDNVAVLKELVGICSVCGEPDGLHASFCTFYGGWSSTPFSIGGTSRETAAGQAHFSKDLIKDANGNMAIQIDAWTEGSITVIPTDIVMSLDHSASVYTAVDKTQIWTWEEFKKKADKEKASQFSGYYVVVNKFYGSEAEDLNGNPIGNGNYCYALVRWNKTLSRWERCFLIRIWQTEYDTTNINTSFKDDEPMRSQTELNTKIAWYPIEGNREFDGADAKYFQSIYGATVDALTAFVDEVKDIPDCRIAFTGFAASGSYGTGVFINQVMKRRTTLTSTDFKNAFIDAGNTTALENVILNYIPHFGGTSTEDGIHLGNLIFENNPRSGAVNRTLMLFTDGVPNNRNIDDYEYPETNSENRFYSAAIYAAYHTKTKYNATVYSVGPALAIEAANEEQKHFMDYISSNYPDATTLEKPGSKKRTDCHIIANNAAGLKAAFKSLGEKIFNASQTMSTETMIRDTITPYFQIGGNYGDGSIVVKQIPYGRKSDGTFGFQEDKAVILYDKNTQKVTVAISQNVAYEQTLTDGTEEIRYGDQVQVKGYDYISNTVFPNEDKGAKIRLIIPIEPDPDFVGGNHVPTNSGDSGIYSGEGGAVGYFPVPETDVPLATIELIIHDIYSYLGSDILESLTVNKIEKPFSLWQGEHPISLNPTQSDFALAWQDDYADIVFTLFDANGNIANEGIKDIREDTSYSVKVTVTAKTEGAYTQEAESNVANIYVFYPELTYEDKTYWYGENVPTSAELQSAKTKLKWKNAEGAYSDGPLLSTGGHNMTGEEPTVTFTCTPSAIGTLPKEDVPVDVTVTQIGYISGADLNSYTWFKWQSCGGNCTAALTDQDYGEKEKQPEFVLHMNTCTLTLAKEGGASEEPYVFTILRNGKPYTEASITGNDSVTIYELPIGVYSLEEDMLWSWRYQAAPSFAPDAVDLSRYNPDDSILCTNILEENQWLNGYSEVIANLFGVAQTEEGGEP